MRTPGTATHHSGRTDRSLRRGATVAPVDDVAPELVELDDLRFDPLVNDAHLAFLATT